MSSVFPLSRTFAAPALATRLDKVFVQKPWGLLDLPPRYGPRGIGRIGEIWFTGGTDQRLLSKYLFTSEKLSIQVHPKVHSGALRSGKTECWYILEAAPDSTIGVGLKSTITSDELREAALSGEIESLLDWRPVRRGDFIVVTPGTIHAVGSGITLLEVGENSGVTYRLYDYGRPRDIHVDEAVAVAHPEPCAADSFRHIQGDEDCVLLDWPEMTIVYSRSDRLQDRGRWVLPLDGTVRSGDTVAEVGQCLFLGPDTPIDSSDANLIIAAAG